MGGPSSTISQFKVRFDALLRERDVAIEHALEESKTSSHPSAEMISLMHIREAKMKYERGMQTLRTNFSNEIFSMT